MISRRGILKGSVTVGLVLFMTLAGNRMTAAPVAHKQLQAMTTRIGEQLAMERAWISTGRDAIVSAPLTGVYYVPGNPSECLILRANPNLGKEGFVLEPADAMASSFLSGFGVVVTEGPVSGKAYIYRSTTDYGVKDFVYLGSSIIIGGKTYWRRPTKAPWKCQTGFSRRIRIFGGGGPAKCQWMMWNPKTGGFSFYYPPTFPSNPPAGGGVLDASTNKGAMAGLDKSGKVDGPYTLLRNTQANPMTWSVFRMNGQLMGWVFTKAATCASPGYTTVTQQVSNTAVATTSAPKRTTTKTSPVSGPTCTLGSPVCVPGNMDVSCTRARICTTVQQINLPRSAYFGSCPGEVRNIFGSGWQLVRRVGPSHKVWHPAVDQLAGTEVYGSPGATDTSDVTFSVKFAHVAFNQFLFMTGDCANWVITSRGTLLGSVYDNVPRTACATSATPNQKSQVRWLNRHRATDPFVSLCRYRCAELHGLIVHVENNVGGVSAKEIVPRNGANVYIRAIANANTDGC